ncbi:MAG TPA: 3-methyl-2-oxobutanoate hydroxymethyltransferase [Candidatus Tumulicola sp.]|nr:3-methyl-2-oxobutanoate hydroxymethyltransferase [Candidatus Tumulicola sp.]
MEKVTVPEIIARKGGTKIAMITAYDTPTARIADRAGADIILVGDSIGNVVYGHDDTLPVTVDIMVRHTAAVSRATPRALVVGDMPWLSYHLSTQDTIRNAARFLVEGHADAVKLEGGRKRIPMVEALLSSEIPVMGHIGLTPQSVHVMGGFRVQGKFAEAARELLDDARALAAAGVFALVLEGIPDVLAAAITEAISVPTIGIGAGPQCDGQVLVFHDVLGLGDRKPAKFVRQYAHLADDATAAVSRFFDDVRSGAFPSEAETYHMPAEDAKAFKR